jgi:uncharacterized surface protein with fasciclin (FAS1) repeats
MNNSSEYVYNSKIDHVFFSLAQLVNLVQTAINNGNFKIMLEGIIAAGVDTTLEGPGPFTMCGPTDAAFAKLPPGTVDDLLKPENAAKLMDLLEYHLVIFQTLTTGQMIAMNPPFKLEMRNDKSVLVTLYKNKLMLNNATIIIPDIFATNGVLHALDTVLWPPKLN